MEVAKRYEDSETTDASKCFISKLPDELLLEAFLLNVQEPIIETPAQENSGYLHNDIVIDISQYSRVASQVCRRWRRVALQSSYLWSRLLNTDPMRPVWFAEVLRRSERSPLKVLAPVRADDGPGRLYNEINLRALLFEPGAFGRIEVLYLALKHTPKLTEMALQCLEMPMPFLRWCLIKVPVTFNFLDSLQVGDEPIHLDNLFAGDAPSLRHLSLTNVTGHIPISFLGRLVSLKLKTCGLGVDELLAILQKTIMLQELVLDHSILQQTQESLSPSSDLLPQLLRLRIRNVLSNDIVAVLSAISPSVQLEEFKFTPTNVYPGPLWDMTVNCIKSLCPPRQRWIDSSSQSGPLFHAMAVSRSHFRLMEGHELPSHTRTRYDIFIQTRVFSNIHITEELLQPLISGLRDGLVACKILRAFVFSESATVVPEAQREMHRLAFLSFRNVETLYINDGYVAPTLQALRNTLETITDQQWQAFCPPADPIRDILLPSLQHLFLPPVPSNGISQEEASIYDKLLEWRKRKGAPPLITQRSKSWIGTGT